jgi:pimeloyl-ACP methyl ester carboxylesterase
VYLSQPHDWLDIFTRRALSYAELVEQMVVEALAHVKTSWDQVAILGFSLGGLTALRVALEVARLEQRLRLESVAYVTFGTPFAGTGRHRDGLIRLLPFDYFDQIFDVQTNQRMLKELCLFGHLGKLRLLFGAVERDEVVSGSSALLPLSWIEGWKPGGDVRVDSFTIRNRGALLRFHDGLLYDSQSIAYIDGLVDGLLPPAERTEYAPFIWRERRRRR